MKNKPLLTTEIINLCDKRQEPRRKKYTTILYESAGAYVDVKELGDQHERQQCSNHFERRKAGRSYKLQVLGSNPVQ
ncbi:hypothetical protein DPMN_114335 [Dreissena polymorpha]|uniref:Uncharacterized protein n=1 Tax=Dreissena polymorpha TaxID=45954 RepID=A0A9D4KJ74_DREPO|nr:hypothetical protein DPMN_114335 [Dreissena polymorpha]